MSFVEFWLVGRSEVEFCIGNLLKQEIVDLGFFIGVDEQFWVRYIFCIEVVFQGVLIDVFWCQFFVFDLFVQVFGGFCDFLLAIVVECQDQGYLFVVLGFCNVIEQGFVGNIWQFGKVIYCFEVDVVFIEGFNFVG